MQTKWTIRERAGLALTLAVLAGLWASPARVWANCPPGVADCVEAESGGVRTATNLSAATGPAYTAPMVRDNNPNYINSNSGGTAAAQYTFTVAAGKGGTYEINMRSPAATPWWRAVSETWGVKITGVNDSNGQSLQSFSFLPMFGPFQGPAQDNSGNVRQWNLTPGTYTITFYCSTAQARLDWFEPFQVAAYTPTPVGVAGTSTKTPTPTRSPTPAVNPIVEGLSPKAQLYDMEYVPFPVQNSPKPVLDLTGQVADTTANSSTVRNTARWRIVLKNVSMPEVAVETRIGDFASQDVVTGQYWAPGLDGSAPITVTSAPMPPRPSNCSRTYFWTSGGTVPVTERFDAMGDPRYTPYRDMLGAGNTGSTGLFMDNYNWFFKNLSSTADADLAYNSSVYAAYLPWAHFDGYNKSATDESQWYNGKVRMDVPKLFSMYRDGVMQSASVYSSVNGWSSFYIGCGGEIGGDSSNYLTPGGVLMSLAPWGASGSAYRNEISQDGSTGTTTGLASNRWRTLVRSAAVDSNSNPKWRCLPWLGELWPDDAYATQWSSTTVSDAWGNLTNNQQGGSWYRDKWSSCDSANWVLYDGRARTGGKGSGTFFNGNDGVTTTYPFNHDSIGETDPLMADGLTVSNDYQFPLSSTYDAARPWDINGLNVSGNTDLKKPEEWNATWPGTTNPWTAEVTTLDVFSGSSGDTGAVQGIYNSPPTGTSSTRRASAAVRLVDRANNRAGWMVVSGLAPGGQAGVNYLANLALLTALRTFHDAGAPTGCAIANTSLNTANQYQGTDGLYHQAIIAQVPFVKIVSPGFADDLSGKSVINVQWQMAWTRWDGAPYTENYPANYASGEPVVYNLKFSTDNVNWYLADSPTVQTQLGQFVDWDSNSGTSYSWNVGSMPPGKKQFVVEAYRPAYTQHYAYHQIEMDTNP